MTQANFSADSPVSSLKLHGRKAWIVGLLLIMAGCSNFRSDTQPTEQSQSPAAPIIGPGKYARRESQFVFYSDFPLDVYKPIFKELSELREQVYKELKLPASNNFIQVFLFEDQDRYEKFMRSQYTGLPLRRAFFIKQPRNTGGSDDLLVFTYRNEHIRQDLRHELTHGLLHSVLKDVPIWLDEGLAEVYELPPEANGINAGHLEQLRKASFEPNLAKLEELHEVKQMQRPEYRESWAWAHYLLHGKPEAKTILLTYLQGLRNPIPPGEHPPKMFPKLSEVVPSLDGALQKYLAKLDAPHAAQ